MHTSLLDDFQLILNLGAKNLVQYNASKAQSCQLSHKKSNGAFPTIMNGQFPDNRDSFDFIGVSGAANITALSTSVAKKVGFLFQGQKYL